MKLRFSAFFSNALGLTSVLFWIESQIDDDSNNNNNLIIEVD